MAGEAIFIGYRRDDTADVAGRIYDAMALRFGKNRIFKDVDNIGPGVDFGDYIKSVLPRCRVALVLIGPHWLESKNESGRRRIDDEHDWVRIEIETALATPDILVVPVLVNGARMPRSEDVPESLRPLLRRNAAIIRRDPDFHDDVERLATALRSSVSTGILDLSKIGGKAAGPAPARANAEKKSNAPLLIGGAVAALFAIALVVWQPWRPSPLAGEGREGGRAEESASGAVAPSSDRPPPPAPSPQGGGESPTQSQSAQSIPLPEMVRIPGQNFEVGRYEVTFAQWDACVADGGCGGYRPSDEGWGRGNRPVINVSKNDAANYARWLSEYTGQQYDLPDPSEWEVAARAGSTAEYAWGSDPPVCSQNARNGANIGGCSNRTLPVGSFHPNAFGLYDIHGNAWEWINDCVDEPCNFFVLRGGFWGLDERYVTLSSRDWRDSNTRGAAFGFRVVRREGPGLGGLY
jgi:hypothetical protein